MKNNSAGAFVGVLFLFILGILFSINNKSTRYDFPDYLQNLPKIEDDYLDRILENMPEHRLPDLKLSEYEEEARPDRSLPELLEDWEMKSGEYDLSSTQMEAFLKEVRKAVKTRIARPSRYEDGKLIIWNWEDSKSQTVLLSYPVSIERQAFEYWRLKDGKAEVLKAWHVPFFEKSCKLDMIEQFGAEDLTGYFFIRQKEAQSCQMRQVVYKVSEEGFLSVFEFTPLYEERYHDRYYDAKMKWYNEKEAFLEVNFSRPTALGDEENSLNIPLKWDEQTQRYSIANKLFAGFIKDDF